MARDNANVTSNYSYDAIYELTQVTQGSTTTESYSYDAVGNRLSSLGVSPYSYNSSNELTSTPSASYTYDLNGNTISKTDSTGTTNYTWDFENRLTQVTLPGTGGTVTFKYDPFGRRIQKAFTQNSTATTTNYFYDFDDSIEETDQNGNVLAKYARTTNVDEPLAESRSAATSFYQQDGLDSITSLSNSAGALANTYTFDSFGKLTASSGSLTNPFRYTGREFDSESNLYFYRARHYDWTTGRFLSEDPIAFRGGPNFFVYSGNGPTNFTDPDGLLKVCCRRARIPGIRQLGACHCFLLLDTGHTLGGYFEAPFLNPRRDNDDDTHPKDKPDCKKVGCADADSKVEKAFDSIPVNVLIYGPNGTSNTIAQRILNEAGISYKLPSCAWLASYPGNLKPFPLHIPRFPPPIGGQW